MHVSASPRQIVSALFVFQGYRCSSRPFLVASVYIYMYNYTYIYVCIRTHFLCMYTCSNISLYTNPNITLRPKAQPRFGRPPIHDAEVTVLRSAVRLLPVDAVVGPFPRAPSTKTMRNLGLKVYMEATLSYLELRGLGLSCGCVCVLEQAAGGSACTHKVRHAVMHLAF